MNPTDHEWTVATDAAAQKIYMLQYGATTMEPGYWDNVAPLAKRQFREAALEIIRPALEALPDRLEPIRQVMRDYDDPFLEPLVDMIEKLVDATP
jgi:hypothetical protein